MNRIGQNGRWFLIAAGLILALTGLAKLFTLTGDTTLLAVADPILGVPRWTLITAVGIGELVIAAFCLFSRSRMLSTSMVAWIASAFLVYRLGLRMVHWQPPCGCLGNLTEVLRMAPQVADWISIGLLGFLLVGSYTFLYLAFVRNKAGQLEGTPAISDRR